MAIQKTAPKTAPAAAPAADVNLDGVEFSVQGGIQLQSERHLFSAERSMAPDGMSYPIRGLLIASEMMGEDRPFTALIVRLTAPTVIGTETGGLKRVEAGDELIVPAGYALKSLIELASGPTVAEVWMRAKAKTDIKGGKQTLIPWDVKLMGRVSRAEALGIDSLFGAPSTPEALPEAASAE